MSSVFLTPVLTLLPAAIRRIRTKADVNHAVFAAAKLLTLAAKHGLQAVA